MEITNISKRKLQGAKTRKKIYETARQLSLTYGIDNVSVDSIVEAAGVSKGTFYVHFKSKDDLTAEFVNEYTDKADLDYKSFLDSISDNESILNTLVLLAEKISDFIDTSIGLENMRVLYKAHLTKTINTTSAMSYQRELYKLFSEVLEKGIKLGEIREDISIDYLSKHLIMAIRGIVFEWCVRYPNFNLKEQVVDHFKILMHGLKR